MAEAGEEASGASWASKTWRDGVGVARPPHGHRHRGSWWRRRSRRVRRLRGRTDGRSRQSARHSLRAVRSSTARSFVSQRQNAQIRHVVATRRPASHRGECRLFSAFICSQFCSVSTLSSFEFPTRGTLHTKATATALVTGCDTQIKIQKYV